MSVVSEVKLDALPYFDQGYDDPGVREAVSLTTYDTIIFYIMHTFRLWLLWRKKQDVIDPQRITWSFYHHQKQRLRYLIEGRELWLQLQVLGWLVMDVNYTLLCRSLGPCQWSINLVSLARPFFKINGRSSDSGLLYSLWQLPECWQLKSKLQLSCERSTWSNINVCIFFRTFSCKCQGLIIDSFRERAAIPELKLHIQSLISLTMELT